MILLHPPELPSYDYPALEHYISVWRSVESSVPWVGTGYKSISPACKEAASSRQWDSTSTVLDDELEKNTATIIGDCIDAMEAVDRALVMYGQCLVRCRWVEDMEPARAQDRYEAALQLLAIAARRNGVDV
jgi:hypothetical protein